MPHIAGDKIASSHTTATEAAAPLVKKLVRDPRVNKLSLGPIDNATSPRSGNPRVKIIDEGTAIILAVSGGGSHQDIRVMLTNLKQDRKQVKQLIKQVAQDNNYDTDYLDRR